MVGKTAETKTTPRASRTPAKRAATKKTATKKTTAKTTKTVTAKSTTRTRATTRPAAVKAPAVQRSVVPRKAPTTIPERGPARNFPVSVALSVAGAVCILGGSAYLGFSSEGQINVAEVISADTARQQAANEAIVAAGGTPTPTRTTPSTSVAPTVPNGGLVGSGNSDTPPPPPPEPVATTTDETATSTESGETEVTEEEPFDEQTDTEAETGEAPALTEVPVDTAMTP